MKTVCIIGLGNAGKIHRSYFLYKKAKIIEIDPRSDGKYRKIEDVSLDILKIVDIFIIAVPTEVLVGIAEYIFKKIPHANVILEKPMFNTAANEERVSRLIKDGKKIYVNDIYNYSKVFAQFSNEIISLNLKAGVKQIKIKFSKYREEDESQGRFVDSELGVLGYEWFHIISCLSKILPKEIFSSYLENEKSRCFIREKNGVLTSFNEKVIISDYSLCLLSSTDETIALKERFFEIESNDSLFRVMFHPLKKMDNQLCHHIFYREKNNVLVDNFFYDNHFYNALDEIVKKISRNEKSEETLKALKISNKILNLKKLIDQSVLTNVS